MNSLSKLKRGVRPFYRRVCAAKALGVGPRDLVLDLASGQDPWPRANILCDKFIIDSTERSCHAGLVIDRPFVVADATATPFPDGSFDFIHCAHLLEHMDDPERLFLELKRMGRRGYIETPSKLYEKLWGWKFHRWFVSLEGNRLVLEAKDRVIFDDDLHHWFGAHVENKGIWDHVLANLHELGLLTAVVWQGDIAFEIRGQASPATEPFSQSHLDSESVLEQTTSALHTRALTRSQRVKQAVGQMLRRKSDGRVSEVLRSLVCPQCRVAMRSDAACWECPECRVLYPIIDGIPVILSEIASPSSLVSSSTQDSRQ